jgi:DNA mismatch endonuclease, patch repair protein
MADVHSKKVRSYNMSRIKAKNTKPEILVRKFLHANGYRYSLHNKKLPGKPDIVLNKYKTVIFVHGCFWRGHKNCKNAKTPVTNRKFWVNKIKTNSERDKRNVRELKKDGWKVVEIWECQLHHKKVERTLPKLLLKLSDKN